ncbi:MAG TPA: glycosyltransferase family 4 protein [Anaerolineales bacterium]
MKIVCVSASQVPSDTANSIQVMKVCQAFTQLGHEVTLLVPGPRPESVDLLAHYGLETLFDIEWLPVRSRRLFAWTAAWRARSLGADLLYAWPIQPAVLAPLVGIPSMLEMHDFPSGRFGPLWFRLFLTLPGKKRLLPITRALQHALEKKYGPMPGGQVVISPDGVDLERYASLPDPESARCQLGLPEAPLVLCTGHLYAGRGADLFLALAAKFPHANFVWVGGRPADVEYWKAQAEQQSLANLTFTGFITNDRIPLYQAAADLLLMPYERIVSGSSGGNTANVCSPMKMFEYLAAGRAIVTSDLPVLREVLDETTAVFCPSEEVGAWESALGGLLADEKRRQALGQRARQAVQQYSWIKRSRRTLESF